MVLYSIALGSTTNRRCDADVWKANCDIEKVGNKANKAHTNSDARAGRSSTTKHGCTTSPASEALGTKGEFKRQFIFKFDLRNAN